MPRLPLLAALLLVAACGGGDRGGEPDADVTPDAGPQPGDVSHLMAFGDVGDDRGQGVAIDGDGNVIITGGFGGAADLGDGEVVSTGQLDAFLIKQGPDAEPLWERTIGDWWTGGIAVDANDAGDIAIAGFFWDDMAIGGTVLETAGQGSGFVAKYDTDGNPVWARAVGGAAHAYAQAVSIDETGNVMVGGEFEETADFGAGPVTSEGGSDIFVARYASADGAPMWSRAIGSTGADSTWSIDLDGDSPIVVGSIGGDADFGCGVHSHLGDLDAYVARLDAADGSCVWSIPIASTGRDEAHGVATDGAGDFVVVGSFAGVIDFGSGPVTESNGDSVMYLAKYAAADAAFRWVLPINGRSFEQPWAVATDADGIVYVTGTYEGNVDFGGGTTRGQDGGDTFIAAYDADAGYLWSQFPVCFGIDFGNGIAADSRTGVIVTGGFADSTAAGGFSANSAGDFDAFIMRLLR